jgi:RNA polymerase sigma-70 factor (ECF subfamily)
VTEQPGEARLVARAAAGRLDAFEELVRRYQLPVYRVALRMLGDRADAEDAAQDAFLQAWQALPGFAGRSRFSTWLYRIVTNRCLNIRRSARRIEPLPEGLEVEAPASRPDRIVEAASELEALAEAIARLSPEQRVPLVLRTFEGCSYEEIAGVLGISVAAVRGRLHRARLELLEAMRPWA